MLMTDSIDMLKKTLGTQLQFSEKQPGELAAVKAAGWGSLNFVTAQRLAHGIGEYLLRSPEKRIGFDGIASVRSWYETLANNGIVVAYDARESSYELA